MSGGARPGRRAARVQAASWGLVLLSAALEAVWAMALTHAHGLTRPGWAAVGLGTALLSLVLLALALRNLPLGSAYAVWIGMGAVGVALAGVLFLGDPLSVPRTVCLALILLGVVGLARTDAAGGGTAAAGGPGRTGSEAR